MKRVLGDERFYAGDGARGFTVLDFWRWSTADLVSNTVRGVPSLQRLQAGPHKFDALRAAVAAAVAR